MLKTVRNIRKLYNAKLLLACSNSYDMAIIDADIEGVSFSELCEELSHLAPTLPKIVISSSDDNESIVTAINSGAYTFLSKPLRAVDVKLAVIMCLNQTKRGDKIEFENGIYFDEYRDQFFKSGGILNFKACKPCTVVMACLSITSSTFL